MSHPGTQPGLHPPIIEAKRHGGDKTLSDKIHYISEWKEEKNTKPCGGQVAEPEQPLTGSTFRKLKGFAKIK